MIVNSTDVQNNFGKYLAMAAGQEIVITRNGTAVARLIGINLTKKALSDSLVGIIPNDVDEDKEKAERLARQ